MVATIPEIEDPELFFGFVAPIGADVQSCVDEFEKCLTQLNYRVVKIKVTDIFSAFSKWVKPKVRLESKPQQSRYSSHIAYGNQLRAQFQDDAFLAAVTIGRIIRKRVKTGPTTDGQRFAKTAYLLYQFKRKEEIDLLRAVYGRLFFQVSVYSRRGARVDYLSRSFANSNNNANINQYRSPAEEIIQKDENEQGTTHGQKVSKIFHEADFIINLDVQDPSQSAQVERFCNLVFGANSISPTKMEYGMFVAKAAALRTLDLSRQVGSAIFSSAGEIISIGSNEVPKGGGGTYWSDEDFDDREYMHDHDSNDRRKKEILSEIIEIMKADIEHTLKLSRISDSQFMDALEYGRIIHAEMSALSDAARLGRSTKDSTLFCTTFPCHMCAKHIVASGISRVVFLEPYPKSLVLDLHSDSIVIEGSDRGRYREFPAVDFEHFFGISPRRYRELFERSKRKDDKGRFQPWSLGRPRPNQDIRSPFYQVIEGIIMRSYIETYDKTGMFAKDALTV